MTLKFQERSHSLAASDDPRVAALSRLLDVALQLAIEQDLTRILQIVTNGVCDAVDCERASLFLIDDAKQQLYTRVVTELEISEIRHGIEHGITGWVARHRQIAHVAEPHDDERWDSSVDRRTGFVTRNILAAPVISNVDERLVGVLQLLNKAEAGFSDFDQQLIRAFAAHVATALERRRLQEEALHAHELEHAMEMGRRIQRGFLPETLPSIPGYEVAVWWQPAEFVSGDYYDWLPLADGRIGFALGDVSGHGLGPSLIMASVRAMLHVLTRTASEPDRIVELLAESIAPDLKQGQFISFLLVSLDPQTHEVRFANAGHAPALHLDAAAGSFRRLDATRLPLGFPRLLSGETDPQLSLAPGDLLVLGTDGCIEVTDAGGTMFGNNRLQQVVFAHRNRPATEIVAAVRDTVQQFHGRPLPPDDSTLLLVKRLRNQ
ncbi:MAG: GAF domain-containing SpoIIE family protein phosphatase [Planctomycetota bacterium]